MLPFLKRGVAVVACICVGCGQSPKVLSKLNVPNKLTLYATDTDTDGRDVGNGRFHGFPILGQMDIVDASQRAEIMAAVNQSIEEGKNMTGAKCFFPRHAIHTESDGQRKDYTICFECEQIMIDDENLTQAVSRSAEPVLNKYLKNAGIALAK